MKYSSLKQQGTGTRQWPGDTGPMQKYIKPRHRLPQIGAWHLTKMGSHANEEIWTTLNK